MSDFPNSYYAASLTRNKKSYSKLTDSYECDVCVIGGGFTGLSTAIEASKQGLKVILIEQNIIGWGASVEMEGKSGMMFLGVLKT